MMRNEWTYGRYVREAAMGMSTAWARMGAELTEVCEGLLALARMLVLFALPFLVLLAPLVALLCRASDRRDERMAAQAREWAKARRVWVGQDEQRKALRSSRAGEADERARARARLRRSVHVPHVPQPSGSR